MRFLADENLSLPTIRLLRAAGLEIQAIRDFSPGAADEQVLLHAHERKLILITHDRDFGELVYRHGAALPAGVLYLRIPPQDPETAARAVLETLQIPGLVLNGHFTVVDQDKVRQRLLPKE